MPHAAISEIVPLALKYTTGSLSVWDGFAVSDIVVSATDLAIAAAVA